MGIVTKTMVNIQEDLGGKNAMYGQVADVVRFSHLEENLREQVLSGVIDVQARKIGELWQHLEE